MFFFTADEHYGHANIIGYCNRPFESVMEMDLELIRRHNAVVSAGDTVVHAGDFTLAPKAVAERYLSRLVGTHVFVRGSHDYWLPKTAKRIWSRTVNGQYVVVCHYAMRTWEKSHYGSWQLYGHSHGMLPPIGKQWDIGVDNNGFAPVSFEQLAAILDRG